MYIYGIIHVILIYRHDFIVICNLGYLMVVFFQVGVDMYVSNVEYVARSPQCLRNTSEHTQMIDRIPVVIAISGKYQ